MADPSRGQRLGFWLLLGLTSTAFAEVLFPTTAFDLTTIALFAIPVYLLHSVVLASPVLYRPTESLIDSRRICPARELSIVPSAGIGVVGASLAVPMFLSHYAVALGIGTASLGAVAIDLRS